MKLENDEMLFETTGRKEYAFSGRISVDPTEGSVHYGYDGSMWFQGDLTGEECVELADHMIALWQQYKERLNA